MSAENRIFFVQIMIDSVNIYNTYKYDKDYGNLKVLVGKFLSYPPLEVSSTPFSPNDEVPATDVKVNEGKTFMFPIATHRIEPVLSAAFVDFQVLLESDSEEKVKAGIHNLQVGYTRIQLKDEMKALIEAVDIVKSDKPLIREIEGAYVVRQADVQVGTLFLGIRFTMFGSSVSSSITSGSASIIDSSPPQITGKKVPNILSNDKIIAQTTSNPLNEEEWYSSIDQSSFRDTQGVKIPSNYETKQKIIKHQSDPPILNVQEQKNHSFEPIDNLQQNMEVLKHELEILKKDNLNQVSHIIKKKPTRNQQTNGQSDYIYRKPKDDLGKEYTYIYSELNGQVIDMQIAHEPIKTTPTIGHKCL